MTVDGIDISHWQAASTDEVNMDGCEFVGIRACYGNQKDALYSTHEADARRHGAVVMAYCFGIPGQPGLTQAKALLAAAPNADLYVLDREADGKNGVMSDAEARTFIKYVKDNSPHKVGLYASESAFEELGQEFNWVANWSHMPKVHWEFWQHRGAPLDLDDFYGTLDQLKALAAGELPPVVKPPAPKPTPKPIPKPKPKPKPVVKAYHTVKSGDTMWAICNSHHLTLKQCLAFPENAKYRNNPGMIHAGDRIRVR
jgi:hypothetical protein